MKPKIVAAILFASLVAFLAPRPAAASWSVSISYFQERLSPYGRWVYTPAYGEIWYPTVVAATWQPYLDGEWAYTDCGWTWVSNDPFGPDPFHYGTWVWVDSYGWCWVPGYVWGPAWVTWAYTDFDIGWAPLPPSFVLSVSGYSGPAVTVASSAYVFVPTRSFVGTNVAQVRLSSGGNSTLLASAHRTTGFTVSSGLVRATDPPPSFVERRAGVKLSRTTLAAHRLTAVPVTAAAARGGKLAIAAPRQEREIASRQTRPGASTTARHPSSTAAGTRVSQATSHSHAAPSRTEHVQSHTSANARQAHVTSSSHQEAQHAVAGKKSQGGAASPARNVRHESKPPAEKPSAATSKRSNPPPPSGRSEEGKIATHSPRPERANPAHPAPPRPSQASRPEPSAPPPSAARAPQPPHPQQAPPKPQKKEKQ
jgi:hypothetical protein